MVHSRRLNIGMIGIGVGGAEILPAMEAMDTIDVVAGADIVPATLDRFSARFPSAKTYASAEALCNDSNVEAVWISSPNRFHAEHTILAANSGKHVVVEKPMAVTLADAERMVDAADKNRVKLLAGHTRAFTLPIRAMRRVIESGQYGQLRALNIWSYSDWMLRPRTADELDLAQGGGIPYRQGPHQVDTVRLLGGGMLRSIRAQVGQWMPERPIPGFYSAFLEFENGTPVTISHNGYGYFLGAELVPWGEDRQRYTASERARFAHNCGTAHAVKAPRNKRCGLAVNRSKSSFAAMSPLRGRPKTWAWRSRAWAARTCASPRGVFTFIPMRESKRLTCARAARWVSASAAPSWRSCTTPSWVDSRCGMTGDGAWPPSRHAWLLCSPPASAKRSCSTTRCRCPKATTPSSTFCPWPPSHDLSS